jgi:hypothetical protein
MTPIREGMYHFTSPERAELCMPDGDWDDVRIDEILHERTTLENWIPPTFRIHHEDEGKKLRRSDCPEWRMTRNLILRPNALDVMGDMLRRYGLLLPIVCVNDDEALTLFEVTNVVDALILEKSSVLRIPGRDVIIRVGSPVFNQNLIAEIDIFRLPQLSGMYVSHRFVELWKSHKLYGLRFLHTDDMTPGWLLRKIPFI